MSLGNWGKQDLGTTNLVEGYTKRNPMCSTPYFTNQMKPHSHVKAICGSQYTCFSIFLALEKVKKIGPKYLKSWAEIQRKLSKVLNYIFHTYLKVKTDLKVKIISGLS